MVTFLYVSRIYCATVNEPAPEQLAKKISVQRMLSTAAKHDVDVNVSGKWICRVGLACGTLYVVNN